MSEQATNKVNFLIQRLYIKDASFEAPGAPGVFKEKWEPELSLDVHATYTNMEPQVYDVCLQLTATVKQQGKVVFIAEVKQAGIFTIAGLSNGELEHALNSYCPNILFPYGREAITDLVTRGGFPQLVLAPINFDALYQQQLAQKTNKAPQHA